MGRGYILVHRKIRDNDFLWPKGRPFTVLEAWLDLLMMASYIGMAL